MLSGCGGHVYHLVEKGDTLYSVSFRYQQDYRDVARWNRIAPPYRLKPGQELRVAPPRPPTHGERLAAARDRAAAPSRPAAGASAPAQPRPSGAVVIPLSPPPAASKPPPVAPARPGGATAAVAAWQWPVLNARARRDVTVSTADKALEFRGRRGEPVRSAADGRVVYSGAGIPHYGNLLIIKHNDRYLSAYAHNQRLLVAEGASVRAGQQIAEMGDSGTGAQEVKLRFEIRLDGSPVDPVQYLPR
ncbi:MAG: peptidoglycan DD-metalloendopeptidase family protein [Gammaproteobacteria bacterium]|jgi:lipoprotein NlpD|nr:peptidoglycan DD-metalloendopeptidase family protein [Gammaproteobacteria bacterium]